MARPTLNLVGPVGLMWLGVSWFAQWFLYLSVAFLPWLLGIPTG